MTGAAASSAPDRGLRAMTEDDLDAVTALHRKAFDASPGVPDATLRSHLRDLFFDHPWNDRESPLPSFVYEEDDGGIVGCLGVMPRPMSLDGEPLLAVVSHNFMVAPSHRPSTVALRLLRALFGGPQDLSLAEGNDASRQLWKALGGATPIAYSLRWTHPLRPARYGLARLGDAGRRGTAATALRPLCAVADAVATRLPGSPFAPGRGAPTAAGGVVAVALDPATQVECIDRLAARRALRPGYDAAAIERATRILADSPGRGPLHGTVLRRGGDGGPVLGWYLYELKPDGMAAVVQLGAQEKTAHEVLDHLLEDARGRGAMAVTGLLDPALMPVFSERSCLFHRGRNAPWLVVHSREERILQAFHRGDAFFTHLEGEWWV